MFDQDRWTEIWQALSGNLLRTALTGLGVFWGIFMMVIMLGAGNGLRNGVTADFGGWATNSMFLWSQRTSIPYHGYQRGRWFRLRNEDVEVIKQQIQELSIISPRNQLGGFRGSNNVIRGLRTGAFSIYGDYPEYNLIEPAPLKEGRFINQKDIEEKRKVCVIGEMVYDYLFEPGEAAIGEYIQINGVYFKVVGISTSHKKGDDAESDMQTINVPFTTFQQAFNYGDVVGWLALSAKADSRVDIMEEKIVELLKERHDVHPDDDRAFGTHNVQEDFDRMNNLFLGIKFLSLFVGLLTLIAGVIGISNIMLVVVKERTQEIGIRRALGATPANVMGMIILEAVMLTTIAGLIGMIAGVWLIEALDMGLQNMQMESGSFRNPEVHFPIVFLSLIILIVSGALAGVIPARKAVSIRPVDAIRTE
jgi:putative ABC transport system permease protein